MLICNELGNTQIHTEQGNSDDHPAAAVLKNATPTKKLVLNTQTAWEH